MYSVQFLPVLWIRIRNYRHHFVNLDPHQIKIRNSSQNWWNMRVWAILWSSYLDQEPHQGETWDPDPHQIKKESGSTTGFVSGW